MMNKYLVFTGFSLSIIFFTCNDSISNDDIVTTMTQQHITWPSLANSSWPMYRHDPQSTGRSQYPGPTLGEIQWTFPAPGIHSSNGFTSFAIGADSTIYFGSSYEKPRGLGQQCVFYALSPDGELKWSYWDSTSYMYIERTPLVTSDNTIVFATPTYIYAINSDGTLKWRYLTENQPSDVNIGRDGTIYFNDGNNALNALSNNGYLLWQLPSSAEFKALGYGGVSISPDGNTLYVTGAHGYHQLYAVSTSGELLWSFFNDDTTSLANSIPMVDNQGNVYLSVTHGEIAEKYGLISLNSVGQIRWFYTKTPAFDGYTINSMGHIYLIPGDILYCLDYAGNKIFSSEILIQTSTPLICDNYGKIFLSSRNAFSIDGETGTILWQIELPETSFKSPVIGYSGTLYLGFAGGADEKFVYAVK